MFPDEPFDNISWNPYVSSRFVFGIFSRCFSSVCAWTVCKVSCSPVPRPLTLHCLVPLVIACHTLTILVSQRSLYFDELDTNKSCENRLKWYNVVFDHATRLGVTILGQPEGWSKVNTSIDYYLPVNRTGIPVSWKSCWIFPRKNRSNDCGIFVALQNTANEGGRDLTYTISTWQKSPIPNQLES